MKIGHLDVEGMGTLDWRPALDNLDSLGEPVAARLRSLADTEPDLVAQSLVADIDPAYSDTDILTEHFGMDLYLSCNCVLVAGKREGTERFAAAVIRATTRADINHTIRQLLDVRKCSFWPQDRAVEESGMEYGGITPVGLPSHWRILIDSRVAEGYCVIGSGLRRSKLAVPGALLASLPGAEIVEGLAVE
ncbi:YbaK/EbsC family protein [Arcanobacterium haemolyticum]|nr:YbaK/EbsC family protein [Arcanobacterium haemolyticum]